jgi:RNA polymerase sigma factor for flagellar operon FliA
MTMMTTQPLRRLARTAADQMVMEQLPLVRAIVRQFARRVPSWVDRQELESAGMLGLAEAANRWQADRGVPFPAFAATRIRGAILDELRRLDTLPRLRRRSVRRLAEVARRLATELGREAGDDELAAALDLPVAEVTALRADAASGTCELDHERDSDTTIESADESIEREQRREQIRDAMALLPARQREVLGLYYDENLTLKQIGARLGVTESRVCQLRTVAERRLRQLVGKAA